MCIFVYVYIYIYEEIHVYVCVYIYICISLSLPLSLSLMCSDSPPPGFVCESIFSSGSGVFAFEALRTGAEVLSSQASLGGSRYWWAGVTECSSARWKRTQ